MEYDICERFCLMAQTARTFAKCNSSSDRHRKTSDSLLLVAAFSATGTIHLQLLQDDSILFQLHSKNRLVEKTTNLIGWPNIGYILVVLTNILVN